MKQYTEIIRATEVDGFPVSVHLASDAPQWLINEATVWVRAIACRGSSASLANFEPDAFEEAMVNIEDLHRVHRVLRLLADRVKALEEQR